jgi:two-component system, OmpR family, sensor kinase
MTTPRSRESHGVLARMLTLWRASLRARLALTCAATLALALSGFATATSLYLSQASTTRVDASLAETMQLVRQALTDEAIERATQDSAAADAVRKVRFSDRRVLIYDSSERLIAVSDSAPLSAAVALPSLRSMQSPELAGLIARRPAAALPQPVTIGRDDASVRGLAGVETYRGAPITVVVLRGLAAEEEASETFVAWLIAAIPVVLLFAGVGGYLLARASLAPALALAEQAEQISATSLNARLAVTNPDDELGRLAGVLNALLSRLELSFTQQRTFMSDASHELRTPIAVVRSAADVALATRGATVATLQDSLNTIHVESVRMSRIVNDLFLLARADSSAHPVRRELLFLEETIAESARAGRMLGRDSGVLVTVAADVEAPFVGDASLLGRMLLNLVDNAVRYSSTGAGVRISLETAVAAQRPDASQLSGDWYRITVEDDGPGVDPAIRKSLFERFVRSDHGPAAHQQRGASGAGLGLAIARWVADEHGGHLWHDASWPDGSRFVVLLPAPQSAASAAGMAGSNVAAMERQTSILAAPFQNA